MPTPRKRKATKARKPSSSAGRSSRPKPGRARAGKMAERRADFGAPVEGFFARQPPALRAILEALRELVAEAAPDASSSIKWGMPFYSIGGQMTCALAAHKAHVNLILAGRPGAFADPGGLLEGEGKTGKHLKLRSLEELPREAVRSWLRTAADIARSKAQ